MAVEQHQQLVHIDAPGIVEIESFECRSHMLFALLCHPDGFDIALQVSMHNTLAERAS